MVEIYANYMGFLDFNKQRYWDVREQENVWFPILQLEEHQTLESDSKKREDSLTLKTGNIEAAQKVKEQMEEQQRHDRSLREAATKRREQGGAKIVMPPNCQ